MYLLTVLVESQSITTSISALPEDTTTWGYVPTLLIEEGKRVIQRINQEIVETDEIACTVVAS